MTFMPRNKVVAMWLVSPAGYTGKGPVWILTHHGEGADTGLHRTLVLLLQPRTLEQPCGGLQQLYHNCLVCLQETEPRGSSATHPQAGAQAQESDYHGMPLVQTKSPIPLALNLP